MSLILKMEEMCGERIEDTCTEMCRLASLLNVCVQVDFNGVTVMSYRGGCPLELARNFRDQLKKQGGLKFASVHGEPQ